MIAGSRPSKQGIVFARGSGPEHRGHSVEKLAALQLRLRAGPLEGSVLSAEVVQKLPEAAAVLARVYSICGVTAISRD